MLDKNNQKVVMNESGLKKMTEILKSGGNGTLSLIWGEDLNKLKTIEEVDKGSAENAQTS